MKVFKRLLIIILLVAIIYMVYYLYTKFNENNISISNLMSPVFTGDSNSVINLDNSTSYGSASISGIEDSTSNPTVVTSSKYNYYYQQLNSDSKIIYSKLEDNINNLTKTNYKIDYGTSFNSLLGESNGTEKLSVYFQAAIDAFFYDHPELFYIDSTIISLYTRSVSLLGKNTYYVTIVPKNNTNYLSSAFPTEIQAKQAISQVESLKNSLASKTSGDDYTKIKQVHDTLINMIEYDSTYSRKNTHNIYGALIEKKVVCEGYSKAFKYVLDSLNIPCILVGGTGTNSSGKTEAHMWNYVKLNNTWYAVDLTWDDPIIIGGKTKNTIRHDYFIKGSISFNKNHVINNKISENGLDFSVPTLSLYDYR